MPWSSDLGITGLYVQQDIAQLVQGFWKDMKCLESRVQAR